MFGPENAQSLVGVAVVLLICWAVSENRRRFPWKLAIVTGLLATLTTPTQRGGTQARQLEDGA